MNSIIRLVTVVAGLVLLLYSTPSWGQALVNPTVSDVNGNTAGGTDALLNVDSGLSGGFNNTAFGKNALRSNTTGTQNTASGVQTLQSNTTGNNNTASGFAALLNNTTGGDNTASGFQALQHNTTGGDNSASGSLALFKNTTGNSNTASGVIALSNNTTGNNNTASGGLALLNNISGNNNTAVGFKALKKSTGTKNIGIGFQAGASLTTGDDNIYVGNPGAGDESQTIRIGTTQTQTFMAGIATTLIVANGAPVEIDTTTGQLGLGFQVSSARYKRDIAPMGARSEKVLKLRPVTFAYKDDAQSTTHYGLIAEEVAAVYPELVTHTATGEVQAVRYQELIPMLLNELQRQRQELAELRALVGQGRRGAESVIPSATVTMSGPVALPR